MTLTKTQRHNRRRQRKINQYLIDRQKEPMFPLAESIANELGDVQPGAMITAREFQCCLYRIADIRAGRVKKSTRNERLGMGGQNAKLD